MSSKSKLSRLQCKDIHLGKKVDTVKNKESDIKLSESQEKIASINTTPVSKKNISRDEMTDDDDRLSPFFMRLTQDTGHDDLDVVWDWESPRSKPNRSLRKRILHSSPKIQTKKQVPNEKNHFNSLKAELEQLAFNLNVTSSGSNSCDSEVNLLKSDIVTATKKLSDSEDIFIVPKNPLPSTTNLFDDDSFDEEMIKCSQKIEETYMLNKWCTSIMNNNNKPKENKSYLDETIQDDSFDIFLEAVDIEKLSQASSSSSPPQQKITKPNHTVSSPRSISRTNSVPIEIFTKPKPTSTVTRSNLVSRTKSDESGNLNRIQCSPEEIEKKRQEARAKLELKRKQYDIERKRLQALERLRKNQARKLSQKRLKTLRPRQKNNISDFY